MRIVICGAGQVGSNIARQLAHEGNEVILIDQDAELIRKINDTLDVQAITGFASHPNVLAKAGLDEADMIIAVTYSDEVNMIACQVAHSLFNVPTKIARVRHQDYLTAEWKTLYSRDHLPIDFIISPEKEVAEAILRRIHVPGALDVIPFCDDKLRVLAIKCEDNCALSNLPFSIVQQRVAAANINIIGMIRDNQFSLPKKDIILREDDVIYVACETNNVTKTLALFGHEEKEARRAIILGGGNVGHYIAKALEKDKEDGHPIRVKLIEVSQKQAEEISQQLKHTTVVHGSGLDKEILLECGITTAESIISVTNDDKVNILASLLAKQNGCKRSISLVNNNSYIPLLGDIGVDVTVNPRESTVSTILQHVRRGKIRGIHSIHDSAAEMIEAEAVSTSPLVGKSIEALNLPKGIRIAAIQRNNAIIIPDNDTVILEHDYIVMISLANQIKKVEKFFSVSLEFF